MQSLFPVLILGVAFVGCSNISNAQQIPQATTDSSGANESTLAVVNQDQEAEIRQLIESLVFSEGDASNQPIVNPNVKIVDADGKAQPIGGKSDTAELQRQKFKSCQEAFSKLAELKAASIPFLVEHLDDDRQSINFRNHYTGNSVGDACYWNIYFQLQDRPRNYSRYGYSRKGRDGEDHPKPYWAGTPFTGGVKKWLEQNENLNYVEMQIKCLEWLLDGERKIGASDADSYFLNILPLENRILERRIENGDNLKTELKRLVKIRDKKLVDQIPKELLPEN